MAHLGAFLRVQRSVYVAKEGKERSRGIVSTSFERGHVQGSQLSVSFTFQTLS